MDHILANIFVSIGQFLIWLNETKVLVDLDGAMGYSSSFLEEAFGGLIRAGFTKECLNKLLVIKSDNEPSLIEEINQYIKESSLNG